MNQARYSAEFDGQEQVEHWELCEGSAEATVWRAGPYASPRRERLGTLHYGAPEWGPRTWRAVEPPPRSAFVVRFRREPSVRAIDVIRSFEAGSRLGTISLVVDIDVLREKTRRTADMRNLGDGTRTTKWHC